MTAIVTDVRYRMSLALIRDLGQAGVDIVACQRMRPGEKPSRALGAASRYCGAYYPLPDEGYAEALLDLCRRIGGERGCRPALLPVGAETLGLAARERERFGEVCGLAVPTAEHLALLNSKAAAGELARSLGVPVPERFSRAPGESVEDFAARLPMPCVVKPDWGEGLGLRAGERYAVARTAEEARSAFRRFAALAGADPVVQEHLPGAALGCSVIAQAGRVAACICHRRVRQYPVSGGPSTCCESVSRPELEQYAGRIVAHLGYTGPAMFEFKEDAAGRPRLLEVNPRIWGSFPLTRAAKSGLSAVWFALAWNGADSNAPVPLPERAPFRRTKLVFGASELAAAAGYLRAGAPGRALRALGSALDPFAHRGVFEWGDPWPGLVYAGSLLRKGREP